MKCYIVPKQDRIYPIGPMDQGKVIHLAISLPVRHQSQLDQLIQQINDPKSPEYRHYLSSQDYTRQFGPTQADYDSVIAFFKHRGFSVTTYPNRTLLDIDGTVRMIEETFHTTLQIYKHPTENRNFYASDENPSIDLDIPLSNVAGLDNFSHPKPLSSVPKKY